MRMGTKSLLFGIHQFFLHPFFVAWAWIKLFGWNLDLRLWVCFFVHDWGYWGKPNMNGHEGQQHPIEGASIVRKLFGKNWGDFCLNHSRSFAKQNDSDPSLLCYADKLAICLYPTWLYILLGTLSGELSEYIEDSAKGKDDIFGANKNRLKINKTEWFEAAKLYFEKWVERETPTHKSFP